MSSHSDFAIHDVLFADENYISGSVLMLNGGLANIPLSSVMVTLTNNVPTSPANVNAECPLNYVPYSATAGEYGQMTCQFTYMLPTSGPAAKPSVWKNGAATVAIGAPSSSTELGSPSSNTPPYMSATGQTCDTAYTHITNGANPTPILY
jgi:hypothetical protein